MVISGWGSSEGSVFGDIGKVDGPSIINLY